MTSTPNTVPKDAPDWFSWVQSRLRVLERHRHTPSLDGELSVLTAEADFVQSMAAGFDFTSGAFITDGTWAQMDIVIIRTGAAYPDTDDLRTDGNILNITMGTLLAEWRPAINTGLTTSAYGPNCSAYLSTNGQMVLSGLPGNSQWTTSLNISFSATWFLDRVIDTDPYPDPEEDEVTQ